MPPIQISCVNKVPLVDPHLQIRNVGGLNPNGTAWQASVDKAVAAIEAGRTFFVITDGRRADVYVAISAAGYKYLKTTADNTLVDHLLSQTEC